MFLRRARLTRRGRFITVNGLAQGRSNNSTFTSTIYIIEMNSHIKQTNKSVVEIMLRLDENFMFILLFELYDAFSNNGE